MNFTTPVSLNARPPEPEQFRGEGAQFVLAAYRVLCAIHQLMRGSSLRSE